MVLQSVPGRREVPVGERGGAARIMGDPSVLRVLESYKGAHCQCPAKRGSADGSGRLRRCPRWPGESFERCEMESHYVKGLASLLHPGTSVGAPSYARAWRKSRG